MSAPEFSRPERIDTIGAGERTITITADALECAALALRFGLLGIERLGAVLSVKQEAGGIAVRGRVAAQVTQACSITEEPLPVAIDEPVALRFVADDAAEEEIELDESALDTIPYAGSAIDLGEAAAETVALALDPFPRGPNAAAALRAAGVLTEEEAKPKGALAGLADVLKKNQS